jgi:fucose 4-O-acetylase-like acetyltransferase
VIPAHDRGSAAGRNRYADLLRVLAIAAVVAGHWLLTGITYRGGQLSGLDAIRYISWAGWVTLGFQVMPVFFLVGGYVHATSWTRHHGRGGDWAGWVREHAMGLLWPTTVYVAAAVIAVAGARMTGAGTAELAQAGWLVALQLWFLPVYLLLIALTPAMLAAHRRWGLAVPAVMALGAVLVDTGVVGAHLPVIGYANYLLVWGSMYQWGFAWRDGTLTHPRWRPYAFAAVGAAAVAGLVAWGPFPVDMIGAGERVGNTTPPSIALLAYAAAEIGLVLAAAPAVSRLLARPRWWRPVTRLTPAVMLVYLWHMVPVVIAAVAFYPTGVMPQQRIGSAEWWELRPAWEALLAVILITLIAGLLRLHRPLLLVLPTGLGPGLPWSPAVLTAGLAATGFGLTRLAIAGFAPGGRLPALVLGAYACGLLLTLLSGPSSPEHGPRPREPGAAPLQMGPGPPASVVTSPQFSFGSWRAYRPQRGGPGRCVSRCPSRFRLGPVCALRDVGWVVTTCSQYRAAGGDGRPHRRLSRLRPGASRRSLPRSRGRGRGR